MLKPVFHFLICLSFIPSALAAETNTTKRAPLSKTPAKAGITAKTPSLNMPAGTTNSPASIIPGGAPSTGNPANPASAAGARIPGKNLLDTKIPNVAFTRNTVIIGQTQFTHVSGDTYNWQMTIDNTSDQTMLNAVLMPSKYTNGSWTPVGAQQTRHIAKGRSTASGTGPMADATKFKLDILAKLNGNNSPLEIVGSQTFNFNPNISSLTDNVNIFSVAVTPYENRFKWTATITNNNDTTFNADIIFDCYQLSGGNWVAAGGGVIHQLGAHVASVQSLTFWRRADSTQFKVVLRSNGQIIKESTPIQLEPINAAIALSNISVTKQGTIATWSTTVTNSGNILLSDVMVKTYQRTSGGQWNVASNPQSVGTLAIGAAKSANNMFSFGSSTQLKIEVTAKDFTGGNGNVTLATQEVNF